MRIVYDLHHRDHRPRTELFYGKPLEHPDRPERVEAVRAVLDETRWAGRVIAPRAYPLSMAELVHEPAYVAHLRARCAKAEVEGSEAEWFPYVWPRDRALDTGTPLLGKTLTLAWASASVALTGADLLLSGTERAAYALCRPPGHHAAAGAMGGYCYFNNAALAAEHLLRSGDRRHGVAVLDLDIHHGNGTQDIFYPRPDVLYCSIHGDPSWAYPPHTGFAAEIGRGAGIGATYNQPLPQSTPWPAYLAALERAIERIVTFNPAGVVLSQGFDTFDGDRWGGFLLHEEDFARIGERVKAIGVPVLALLEGGYEPDNIAAGSLALLDGLS